MSLMFRLCLGRIEMWYICCLILWSMMLLTNTCMPDLQYGKRLLGSTFKIIEKSALFACAAECSSYGICKSFNFELGLMICHLNGDIEGGEKDSDLIHSTIMNWNKTALGPCQKRSCGITQKCSMKRSGIAQCEEFLFNIAKDKPASASSMWPGDAIPPSVAVDGDVKALWTSGSCFATDHGDFSPWWQVDLLDTYVVVEVHVTNREDYRPERLHDFSIDLYQADPRVNPSLSPQLCFMYNGAVTEPGKTVAIQCISRITGRYMRLSGKKTIVRSDCLQFCEVRVFGFKLL